MHDALERLRRTGQGDLAHLVGTDPPELRPRVGDWRVRLRRDPETRTISVLHVRHRREAHRGDWH